MRPTPEDVLNAVIAADDLRRKAKGQTSTRAALALEQQRHNLDRVLVEPFFNFLGHLWALEMQALPSRFRRPFVLWVQRRMGGYVPPETPDLPQKIQETVKLARELKQTTGAWPALLVFTSHPDTEGSAQWLRFELLRQGMQIADAVVEVEHPGSWYPPHPKCFLAIDPYALDTVSPSIGGFYSGWMHRLFMVLDRQPSTQSWIQKHFLLRGTDSSRIAWRLLRLLQKDVPVLMALGGGLPYNARLLYGVREFIYQLPIKRWTLHRRQAQIDLITLLMKPEGSIWPAEQGELPPATRQAVSQALLAWGLEPSLLAAAMEQFEADFKLPVPFRPRLFRILMQRLVGRGKPLLLVAISHTDKSPYVRIGEPVPVSSVPTDVTAFARKYVNANF